MELADPWGGSACGNWEMEPGREGFHVIDISDKQSPDVVDFVETPCGTHTETLVPDLDNNPPARLHQPVGQHLPRRGPGHPEVPFPCRGIDIGEVPLGAPRTRATCASCRPVSRARSSRTCTPATTPP